MQDVMTGWLFSFVSAFLELSLFLRFKRYRDDSWNIQDGEFSYYMRLTTLLCFSGLFSLSRFGFFVFFNGSRSFLLDWKNSYRKSNTSPWLSRKHLRSPGAHKECVCRNGTWTHTEGASLEQTSRLPTSQVLPTIQFLLQNAHPRNTPLNDTLSFSIHLISLPYRRPPRQCVMATEIGGLRKRRAKKKRGKIMA